jgi:hypothetical protein
MFHKTWQPMLRPRVLTLIDQYESYITSSSSRNSLDSDFGSRRQSYILDSVPEDPTDHEDYMVPMTPVSSPVAPCTGLRNQRSLPRMAYKPPTTDSDAPMPNAWPITYGEVSPKTDVRWPTLAEANAEGRRANKLKMQRRMTPTKERTKKLVGKSIEHFDVIRKIRGKYKVRRYRRLSTPRGSEETFDLRTPKKALESKPSFKSRAKRAARGAIHGIRSAPAVSVDAVGNALEHTSEATAQTAKAIRKTASKTHMRVVIGIEDTKAKVSTSLPGIRPPRSRYLPIQEGEAVYNRPVIDKTHTTPGSQLCTVPTDLDGPWPGIIPPPPSPSQKKPRNRLRKRQHNPFGPTRNDVSNSLRSDLPVSDAIFAQASLASVKWQAQDAAVPIIIVTDGAQNSGSWYPPVNEREQTQFCHAASPRFLSSASPRSSADSEGSFRSFLRKKKW